MGDVLDYISTPVEEIAGHPLIERAGVRLLVKREDLNHPFVSGNKWWKLKYNIRVARLGGHDTLLTFGGHRSNHIYATAAAAEAMGMQSIGIIRGEEAPSLNPTLQFAVSRGMKLFYISRAEYREKASRPFLRKLQERFGNFYLIPEGGTNDLAVMGCTELGSLIDPIPADYVCLPVGTGGTMAGIIRGTSADKRIIGFSVVKNGGFLRPQVHEMAGELHHNRWDIMTEYAFGGYAKRSEKVDAFMKDLSTYTDIPLDFVYTGKMMCAVFELVAKGYFEGGKTILAVHTGGLQGNAPFTPHTR